MQITLEWCITLKGLGGSTKYLPCDALFKSDALLEPSA